MSTLPAQQLFMRGVDVEGEIKEHMCVERDPPSSLAEKWREVLILGRGRVPQEWLQEVCSEPPETRRALQA